VDILSDICEKLNQILENMQKTTILLTLLLGLTFGVSSIAKTTERPNVVFIICDDLNDYEGIFGGHPQAITPNIDKLAKSGVQFMNAQSNTPVCSPSRNSLFTGVYSYESGDFGWTPHFKQPVLKNNKTMIEYLNENGYYTMGSGKLLHSEVHKVWQEWGVKINNYGPFAYNGTKNVGHPNVPQPYRSIGAVDGSFSPIEVTPIFSEEEQGENKSGWRYEGDWSKTNKYFNCEDANTRDLLPDEMHAQWAAKRISEMDKQPLGSPFFMGVGFVRPHTPLHAPQRFFDMFPLEDLELSKIKEGDADDTHFKDLFPVDGKGLRFYRTIKESYDGDAELGLKHFLQAYLACVAFVDEQVGMVVDAVNNSQFKDNTIIVLTADHGWQMGEKDYLFKNSPWEESTRIPMVIAAPNAKAGGKVEHPVALIDLFPTIADMCGLEGDNKKNENGGRIGGYSLVPFLENPNTTKWEGPIGALSMVGNAGGKGQKTKENQSYSYRTKDFRYIIYYDGSEELYDHSVDNFEWNNLADNPKYSNKKKELKKQILEMIN
jgi:arylsulfatase A-like enzyme